MAITFEKTDLSGLVPAIWRGEAKILPGGFKPLDAQTLETGAVIYRGTPICIDFDNHTAAVCKTATVLAGGTTSKPRVAKGHTFAKNDVVAKNGKTDASRTISSIDTSNSGYDVINLSSAITGLTTGDVLVESIAYGYIDAESTDTGALKVVASGASTGQINLADVTPYLGSKTLAANDYVVLQNSGSLYAPNAVVGSDLAIDGKGIPAIDAAYDCVVLKNHLKTPVLSSWFEDGSPCLKLNPNILFI